MIDSETRQYLSFRLGNEAFGIDVIFVREILDSVSITRLPDMPAFLSGIINLRGKAIPVADMRIKYNIDTTVKPEDSCIIVLDIRNSSAEITMGIMVDSVQEVFELSGEDIEPAPLARTQYKIDFIKGLGKRYDEFIIILNPEKIMTSDDMNILHSSVSE